jgi:hypothetical protein
MTDLYVESAVVPGAGHEIQFTGAPLNDALLALWRTEASSSGLVERPGGSR